MVVEPGAHAIVLGDEPGLTGGIASEHRGGDVAAKHQDRTGREANASTRKHSIQHVIHGTPRSRTTRRGPPAVSNGSIVEMEPVIIYRVGKSPEVVLQGQGLVFGIAAPVESRPMTDSWPPVPLRETR